MDTVASPQTASTPMRDFLRARASRSNPTLSQTSTTLSPARIHSAVSSNESLVSSLQHTARERPQPISSSGHSSTTPSTESIPAALSDDRVPIFRESNGFSEPGESYEDIPESESWDQAIGTGTNVMRDDEGEEEKLLPPMLGPLLPTNPRDTVFSVISGYGHDRNESIGTVLGAPPLPDSVAEEILTVPVTPTKGAHIHPSTTRQSYASSSYSDADSETWSAHEADQPLGGDEKARERDSTVSSDYGFPPPPRMEDIEAIARQPSPGRVEHGIPLQSRECSSSFGFVQV